MDGLRAGVRDVHGLDGDVTFRVHKLAVLGDYALTTVTPLNPDGSRISTYEDAEDMYCDKEIIALLRGSNGRGWRVIGREVGPCDYAWPYLFEQNPGYPAALLRYWENMETSAETGGSSGLAQELFEEIHDPG